MKTRKIIILVPVLMVMLLILVMINPKLSYEMLMVLQVFSIISLMAFMGASIAVIKTSSHSFYEFIRAVFYSYSAMIRRVACPRREQVIIRYHSREWRYLAHCSLMLFQALMLTGMLENLYTGQFLTKSIYLFVGSIGLFSTLSYLTIISIKEK